MGYVMEAIEKTNHRQGNSYLWKFKCPVCNKTVLKPKYEGNINRTCSWVCRDKRRGKKEYIIGAGYVFINKPNHPSVNKYYKYVKRCNLVIEKHIGRYLVKGEVVHHINNIRDDDRIENLKLMTKKEHRRYHLLQRKDTIKRITGKKHPWYGKDKRGEKNCNAKLTEAQVISIKKQYNNGDRLCDLGRQYNVTSQAISNIIKGKTWGYIL